ncbi:MAG: glycoside hydrolase family 78 protein [Clostridium sp.]|nr:glycoside hydrolase family 78 protein [Clostridium sp.]
MMKRTYLFAALMLHAWMAQADIRPTHLQVAGRTAPLGIDRSTPTFSWQTESDERGFRQAAYQIVVTDEDGREVWNTGTVTSPRQNNIEYAGTPLDSRTAYRWSVSVTGADGQTGEAQSTFETAFMNADEWQARWIEADISEPTGQVSVQFDQPAECRYVRLDITRLGLPAANDPNYYFAQLAEMEIYADGENVARQATFTASESWEQYAQWNLKFINDGIIEGDNSRMGYTTQQKNSPDQHVWITARLPRTCAVERIVLYPRQDVTAKADGNVAANFPASYTLQTSSDGVSYTTRHSVTDGAMPSFTAAQTGNVPYLGRSFMLPADKQVKRARLYASALGVFTMRLNGQPVTSNRLEPGETEYGRSVLYSTYDVTPLVQGGHNALLAQVAGGLFNVTPVAGRYSKGEIQNSGNTALLAELIVDYTDGTTDRITTDSNWRCAPSPTTGSNWWGGEDYDARLYNPQIMEHDYDFATWKPVQEVTPSFRFGHVRKSFDRPGTLKARAHEPLRVVETWPAVNVRRMSNGDYMVDFGRNYAGTYRFSLRGKRGQTIRLREFERLDANGNGYIDNWYTGTSVVYEEYTFGGTETETWGPEFMYHGFRYMQVSGLDEAPSPSDFTALRIRSAMEQTGQFATSNTLLNDIHTLCRDAIQSQLYNTITDCPQREKLGWLDVPNEMFNSLCFNYDMTTFWDKVVMDCFDAQGDNGFVPSTAPWYMNVYADDPNWGGTAILVPYRSLKTYGDDSLLKRYYPQMRRLMDYYTTRTDGYIMQNYSVLSDWGQSSCGLAVQTPTEFTITTTYYYLLRAMAEMAELMDEPADATRYTDLADHVKTAFNNRFLRSGNVYNNGNQAEYSMALYYGLVDEANEAAVAALLAEKVKADNYRIRTGEIGLKPVIMSLARHGYNDVVYRMANQTDYPSYGFFVKSGCTTTPEYWDMNRADNSQNHCMMDHIEEWFYSELGGIHNAGTAFDRIELAPWIPADMHSLDIRSQCPYGTIRTAWRRHTSGGLTYEFTVPTGTTAVIRVPLAPGADALLEDGSPLEAGTCGISAVSYTDSIATVEVGSGCYRFTTGDVTTDDPARRENFWMPVHRSTQLPAGSEIKIQEAVHNGHSGRFLGWCAAHGQTDGEFVTGADEAHAVTLRVDNPGTATVDTQASFGLQLQSTESGLWLQSLADGGRMLSWGTAPRRWGLDIEANGNADFYRQTEGGSRAANHVFFFDNGANSGVNAFGTTSGENLWRVYRRYNVADEAPACLAEAIAVTDSVFYTRLASRDGRPDGLCLPFDVPAHRLPSGFTFYRFGQVRPQVGGTASLIVEEVDELEAGMPYLMRYTGTDVAAVETEAPLRGLFVTATPATLPSGVTGCLATLSVPTGQRLYVLNETGNAFVPATDESVLSPFRLCLLTDEADAPERYEILFDAGDDVPDGIVSPMRDNGNRIATGIYTTDGRFVGSDIHSLPAGLYITGGHKLTVNRH